jgi:thiopurine S-methyltransferase
MELSYWQSRWNKGNIGFHMEGGYPGLQKNWPQLNVSSNAIVMVPLCGKSNDMAWIAGKVEKVVGVEISEKAILDFFNFRDLTPKKEKFASFTIFKASNIELWCGDFFKFPAHKYPKIDLIYDKAALVALPKEMRNRYAKKIIAISNGKTNFLLHHFVYDKNEMSGPPFSVSSEEVNSLFGNHFLISILEENELDMKDFEKFKKRGLNSFFHEKLLLLTKR